MYILHDSEDKIIVEDYIIKNNDIMYYGMLKVIFSYNDFRVDEDVTTKNEYDYFGRSIETKINRT
jgi:hypothetical protein